MYCFLVVHNKVGGESVNRNFMKNSRLGDASSAYCSSDTCMERQKASKRSRSGSIS